MPEAWPITSDACERVRREIELMRQEIRELGGQGLEEGITRLSFDRASRRLETLAQTLAKAQVVDSLCCAIGRQVRLRDDLGELVSGSIVAPGEEQTSGAIPVTSPLGTALLGARPGDTIRVHAPTGTRSLTVVGVD